MDERTERLRNKAMLSDGFQTLLKDPYFKYFMETIKYEWTKDNAVLLLEQHQRDDKANDSVIRGRLQAYQKINNVLYDAIIEGQKAQEKLNQLNNR